MLLDVIHVFISNRSEDLSADPSLDEEHDTRQQENLVTYIELDTGIIRLVCSWEPLGIGPCLKGTGRGCRFPSPPSEYTADRTRPVPLSWHCGER